LPAVLLAACGTPYQPRGATGGYAEQQLSYDTYQVQFFGNGNTPKDTVQRYFLYRCAELTREKGFKYFSLLRPPAQGSELESGFRNAALDGSGPDPSGLLRTRGGGGGGGHYVYVPGGTYTVTVWTGRGTIRMYNDWTLPDFPIVGWVASDVQTVIGPF